MIRPGLLLLSLAACVPQDESIAAYVPENQTYRLTSVGGADVTYRATIEKFTPDAISGHAPCNRYTARQTAPYPWLEISGIASTKMACPDLSAEAAYFATLQSMTIAEVLGGVLILSNDAGAEMIFQASP